MHEGIATILSVKTIKVMRSEICLLKCFTCCPFSLLHAFSGRTGSVCCGLQICLDCQSFLLTLDSKIYSLKGLTSINKVVSLKPISADATALINH